MKIDKKTIFQIVFFVIVLVLTVSTVFRGENLKEVIKAAKTANLYWLAGAAGLVIAFILIQGIVLFIMLKEAGHYQNFGKCILYAFSGYFFVCITPFGSGGPPMQMYYMSKQKIKVADSSVILLLIALMYKMVVLVVGVGLVIFGQAFLRKYFSEVIGIFGLGMFMTAGFCFLLLMFIFHKQFAKWVLVTVVGWLEDKKILKKKEGRVEETAATMEKYKETAKFFREHVPLMGGMFLLTALQRFCFFAVPYCVYRSFHLKGTSIFLIVLLQAAIALSVDILPLPGGLGISEAMFMSMFAGIFGSQLVLPGMVLSRGLSYYVELAICAVMAIVAHFVLRKHRPEKHERVENESEA